MEDQSKEKFNWIEQQGHRAQDLQVQLALAADSRAMSAAAIFSAFAAAALGYQFSDQSASIVFGWVAGLGFTLATACAYITARSMKIPGSGHNPKFLLEYVEETGADYSWEELDKARLLMTAEAIEKGDIIAARRARWMNAALLIGAFTPWLAVGAEVVVNLLQLHGAGSAEEAVLAYCHSFEPHRAIPE